jgi:hypothetical protein
MTLASAPLNWPLRIRFSTAKILIPQQQLLVRRPRDESQNAGPVDTFPPVARRSAVSTIERPKNVADDARRSGEATPACDKYPPCLPVFPKSSFASQKLPLPRI